MSNRVLWTKKSSAVDGSAEAAPSGEKVTRYIMVTCRPLNADESKVLSKNFKNIILFDANLHAANTDLDSFAFDLLIINVSNKESHLFLEIVSPQAKSLNIPIIVVKRSLSNYKQLVDALGAYVVSRIEDLDGTNFLNFLVKEKLPKLESKLKNLFLSCWSLVSKQ